MKAKRQGTLTKYWGPIKEQKQPSDKPSGNTAKLQNSSIVALFSEEQEQPTYTRRHTSGKYRKRVAAKKTVWPYMLSIVMIILIAISVVFLYMIHISRDHFFMSIRDKEAPIIRVTDLDIYNDETVSVMDFVTECDDVTNVKLSFQKEIDYSIDGDQIVTIVAVDEAGHKTVKSARLSHVIDSTAPTVVGDAQIRAVRGESISYKKHISVQDDHDPYPQIEVDNSEVNLEAEGTYPVHYTVTDFCGNSRTFDAQVVVTAPGAESVSDETLNEFLDTILGQITTDDMDDIHKVWAVYEYVRSIPYSKTDYSFDYRYEGYKILRDQKGDCFGSYSASRLLLERLGYQTLSVESDKVTANKHFWNMVSIDGGKTFYHFDATHWHEWGTVKPVMCMICDDTLKKISDDHKGTHTHAQAAYPYTPASDMPVPSDIPAIYGEGY